MSELALPPSLIEATHEQLELPLSARRAGWADSAVPRAEHAVPRDDEDEEWIEREGEEYADAVPPAYCACDRPLVLASDDPYDEARCVWCGHRAELAR